MWTPHVRINKLLLPNTRLGHMGIFVVHDIATAKKTSYKTKAKYKAVSAKCIYLND